MTTVCLNCTFPSQTYKNYLCGKCIKSSEFMEQHYYCSLHNYTTLSDDVTNLIIKFIVWTGDILSIHYYEIVDHDCYDKHLMQLISISYTSNYQEIGLFKQTEYRQTEYIHLNSYRILKYRSNLLSDYGFSREEFFGSWANGIIYMGAYGIKFQPSEYNYEKIKTECGATRTKWGIWDYVLRDCNAAIGNINATINSIKRDPFRTLIWHY